MEENQEIPKDFYAYDTGEPFTNCIQCGRSLQDTGISYLVERSIKRYPDLGHTDVIYEYAMCMSCVEKQKEALSEESLKSIEQYLSNKLEPAKLFKSFEGEAESGTCAIYGTPVHEMNEYVLQGAFIGKEINPGFKPMIFGEKAIEEMSELISIKTRGEMDDFIDNHFSGPPEWREIIRNHKKVLI